MTEKIAKIKDKEKARKERALAQEKKNRLVPYLRGEKIQVSV